MKCCQCKYETSNSEIIMEFLCLLPILVLTAQVWLNYNCALISLTCHLAWTIWYLILLMRHMLPAQILWKGLENPELVLCLMLFKCIKCMLVSCYPLEYFTFSLLFLQLVLSYSFSYILLSISLLSPADLLAHGSMGLFIQSSQ